MQRVWNLDTMNALETKIDGYIVVLSIFEIWLAVFSYT